MDESGPNQDDEVVLPAPRVLGRYEVIAEIARGGMGVVYLARRESEAGFARLFAVKVLYPHLAEEHSFIEMLRDEARIAARLHHPGVVPIVDLGVHEGNHYVVMEYVDGCALSALLSRNKTARPAELVAAIMIDALEGLHAAHTLVDDDGKPLGLVHRDVTPQNILVGADGATRITDFGIAKAEARVTTTRPGTWKGKFSYMAPEQLMGDGENVDQRADIFSAGAVLWTALTGKRLFRAESDGATLHNVLHKEILPPSEVGFGPPKELDAVCLKALARDPDGRYQTALEMAEALRAALPRIGRRAEVAEWVNGCFGKELAARRAAIRAAAREHAVASGALPPALPHVGRASITAESWPAPALSEPPASGAGTTLSPHADPTPVAFGTPSRRSVIAVVGAVGALILLAIVIGSVASGADETPASSAAAVPAEPSPAVPLVPAEPEETPEPAASVAVPASALPTVEPAPVKPRPGAWRPHKPAAPVSKPTATTASTAEAPAPKPTATAKPTSKPNSGMIYEKNPYLKRE